MNLLRSVNVLNVKDFIDEVRYWTKLSHLKSFFCFLVKICLCCKPQWHWWICTYGDWTIEKKDILQTLLMKAELQSRCVCSLQRADLCHACSPVLWHSCLRCGPKSMGLVGIYSAHRKSLATYNLNAWGWYKQGLSCHNWPKSHNVETKEPITITLAFSLFCSSNAQSG